jgi:hypothetical protein
MWPFDEMSLSWATRLSDVANLVLLASLIGGVIATFVIVRTANVKEHHWEVAREQSQERIAELQTKVAEANAHTEQLRSDNLRLQKAILPRRIVMSDRDGDKDTRSARFDAVRKYAGTVALIQSVPDFEAQILASDVRIALHNSGWNAVIMNEAQSHIASGLISEGVQVLSLEGPMLAGDPPVPDPNWSVSEAGRAANAVEKLLSLDLGPPHGPPLFGVHWSPQYKGDLTPSIFTRHGFVFPEGGIVILVGMRPIETALP